MAEYVTVKKEEWVKMGNLIRLLFQLLYGPRFAGRQDKMRTYIANLYWLHQIGGEK